MGVMNRRGVTLLELLVVIVLLGAVASVSGFALAGWRRSDRAAEDPITAGRRRAIMTGQAVRLSTGGDSLPQAVLLRPDGRVVREPAGR